MSTSEHRHSHKRVGKILTATRLAIVLALLIMPFIIPPPDAYALISQPTSTPRIGPVFFANRNLVSTGDILIYANYDLPYSSIPSVAADESFMFRLMDSTLTVELGVVTPFAYSEFDNGYNEGNIFFYFAAGANVTWDGTYYIRISENPTHFASPTYWDYLLPATAWTSNNTTATNQAQVATNVLSMAKALQAAHGHTMTTPSAGGVVLSNTYGETYYRGACYGLQAMAPTLFWVQVLQLDVSATSWTTIQADSYEATFGTTWVGSAENATATRFGVTRSMIPFFMLTLPVCLGIMVVSSLKYRRMAPGLSAIAVWLIGAFLIGWIPQALFATIYQLMGIYTGWVWFFRTS